MFINYRRPHAFPKEEIETIESIASSVAIAIKNRRMLDSLKAVDREIISTLDSKEILGLIVRKAAQNAGPEVVGHIALVDPTAQSLAVQAVYPSNGRSIEITRSPIGCADLRRHVAEQGKSALKHRIRVGRSLGDESPEEASELCAPLVDRTGKLRGVLGLRTCREGAFDRRDQHMLEALATSAVLAIEIAEQRTKRAAADTMATLGGLADRLLHDTRNPVGKIKMLADDITSSSAYAKIKVKAKEIRAFAGDIEETMSRLSGWIPTDTPRQQDDAKNGDGLTVDVMELVRLTVTNVSVPSNITIEPSLPRGLPKVLGAEQHLVDILEHLVRNAIEAMPSGGTLVFPRFRGQLVRQRSHLDHTATLRG